MAGSAQLSKNVLQMKFMQRSVLRIEREQNEEEQQRVIDDEHWVLDLPAYKAKEDTFVTGLSFTFCENSVFGRQSYQGFNPEIEKLMKQTISEKELQRAEENEKEQGVNDNEMAKRYSSLMGVIAKKFAKKRQRSEIDEDDGEPSTKKKFLKPSDDDS